ncbi:hypothetical protein M758_8G191600 [Ceratodon purpureus]|nr:hypothetical protein M758_8G191600 [Ceratodon purpureus]
MASTSSEYDQAEVVIGPEGYQINPSEVIYYTERLKEYYNRSDNDVMSTVSTGTKTKYLDQLKDQLQIGEDDQSKAAVPHDPDPTGMRETLEQLGKEDLMNLTMNMAKKWEEGGKPAEIKTLLDTALASPRALPTIGRELTGIDRILRDGLLAFLVKIRQFLPKFPSQLQCR